MNRDMVRSSIALALALFGATSLSVSTPAEARGVKKAERFFDVCGLVPESEGHRSGPMSGCNWQKFGGVRLKSDEEIRLNIGENLERLRMDAPRQRVSLLEESARQNPDGMKATSTPVTLCGGGSGQKIVIIWPGLNNGVSVEGYMYCGARVIWVQISAPAGSSINPAALFDELMILGSRAR